MGDGINGHWYRLSANRETIVSFPCRFPESILRDTDFSFPESRDQELSNGGSSLFLRHLGAEITEVEYFDLTMKTYDKNIHIFLKFFCFIKCSVFLS